MPSIDDVSLLDEDETPVVSKEIIGPISKERRQVWWSSRLGSECAEQLSDDDELIAVRCTGGRGLLEHAVIVKKDGSAAAPAPLLIECKVSYEELPPSSLVEYKFEGGNWRLSMVCLDYLLAFRAGKFKDWEKRILSPTCKAEFRRMIQIGPVFQVFDHLMFPSPDDEKDDWEVTNEQGKKVILPRPVSELRIWNTEKQDYDVVDPTLDGTPSKDERDDYWKNLLETVRESFPEEVEEILGKKQ